MPCPLAGPPSSAYLEEASLPNACNEGAMRRRGRYALLLLPFIGTLSVPAYNHARPALFGMPFFYWYQLAWVLVTALLLGLFVALTHERDV